MKAQAARYGYVPTIPDKTVNPYMGYPLWCSRTDRGSIKPTLPLNYHVQSTACWWMMKAMIRCHSKLKEWSGQGFDGFITLQIHDELVFDFPKRKRHPLDDLKYEKEHGKLPLIRTSESSNLWRVRTLQKLMAMGGDDIGIPTPVGCEYNENDWSTMVKC